MGFVQESGAVVKEQIMVDLAQDAEWFTSAFKGQLFALCSHNSLQKKRSFIV